MKVISISTRLDFGSLSFIFLLYMCIDLALDWGILGFII